jgi:hypothetical protein
VIVVDGEERIVERAAAIAAGYTVVSFGDDWTPFIFQAAKDPEGNIAENRYRQIFLGLSADETDPDGRKLPDDEKNYLEVFGIPPNMSVLRKRFVEDETKACLKDIDYDAIGAVESIPMPSKQKQRRNRTKLKRAQRRLEKAMKKAKLTDLEALRTAQPKLGESIDLVQIAERRKSAFVEIEKRLNCDGHNHKKYKHRAGRLDDGLRRSLRRFQRKNKVYEYASLRPETIKLLAMRPRDNNYLALKRTLQERVVAATGILEDGSATVGDGVPVTWRDSQGVEHPVRNLVEEFTTAAMGQLGIDSADKAQDFFQRHEAEVFADLEVGVKFPPLPAYYSENMELKFVIDRGTVWYDYPWNEKGRKRRQARSRMPKARLYVLYNEQEIPIVKWSTTIGGWRTEQAKNGYVYMRYKGSDVGNRVIRKIIAGPTWIPPFSTPLKSLAKRRYVNGRSQWIVNYSEMGPGYLSAYGLVAGYFVIPGKEGRGDVDKGIRAHGSSDYMSIFSSRRFSHGCHRLVNHQAVRLYGFILNHRHFVVTGDQVMNYDRQFLYKEQVFQMRVPSRGFQYTLDPPIPVSVLKGTIKGREKKPLDGYFKIPGKPYPAELPSTDGKKKKPPTEEVAPAAGGGE